VSDFISILAEKKMKEAVQKGTLHNLPGEGQPLDLEELNPFISEEDRKFFKLMKNLGMLPPEVLVMKDIESIKEQLETCEDAELRKQLKLLLQEFTLQHSLMMEARLTRRG
jgi:hypothetical protein